MTVELLIPPLIEENAVPTRDEACSQAGTTAPAIPSRDVTVDAMRGLCILLMVTNHLAPATILNRLTHASLYVDGAFGFVFLSGYVLGLIHEKRIMRDGEWYSALKIWKRARLIWIVHIAMSVGLVTLNSLSPISSLLPTPDTPGAWTNFVLGVLTLRVQPPYLDILPLYVVLLAAAPGMLALMRRGAWGRVGAISIGLYSLVQFWPNSFSWSESVLNPAAWQLVFFGGMALGCVRASLVAETFSRINRRLAWIAAVLFVSLFAVAQLQRPALAAFDFVSASAEAFWLGKSTMGPARLVYSLAAGIVLYQVIRWLLAIRFPGRLAEFLAVAGRASLYLYIVHLLVLFAFQRVGVPGWTLISQELVLVGTIAGLYFAGSRRFLGTVIPN